MPTVLVLSGWRCYVNSNAGDEPMHIFAQRGNAECKFWLHPDQYVVQEELEHNLTERSRREVRRIVYQHFDELCAGWLEHIGGPVA